MPEPKTCERCHVRYRRGKGATPELCLMCEAQLRDFRAWWMRYIDQMTFKQIAAAVGLKARQAVRDRVARYNWRLRRWYRARDFQSLVGDAAPDGKRSLLPFADGEIFK